MKMIFNLYFVVTSFIFSGQPIFNFQKLIQYWIFLKFCARDVKPNVKALPTQLGDLKKFTY